MADYNVWADLFRTWQSTSDWIKAVAIVTPPAFAMGALALLLRYRLAVHQDLPRPYHLLEAPQHPAQPSEMIDSTAIDAANDLQNRLEEARRTLMQQGRSLAERSQQSDPETRQQIEQIILEEYHRKSDPAEALARVRQFVTDQRRSRDHRPEVGD
ncbi:protein kinase [Agrobacterium vitis]|uniref:Protein kinase n=1 Tax=Agrobacterium vitis TaxID=373 RepID=A0AAE5AXD3_AGRVI|nr:protein kinase [Agrobacterium vitis]MUZ59454.1 protein kinase [Agrobacterium vitis]